MVLSEDRFRPIVRSAWLLATAIALAACAHPRVAAPPDPSVDIAGFRPGPISPLTLDEVAADALDPSQLEALLQTQGFTGATLRAFSAGVDGPVRTVRVEIVAFDRPTGARAYLGWLHDHAAEVIGAVEEEPDLDPPGAFVLSHAPSACCSKEQGIWLAAWPNGSDAVWVQVMGPDVRRESVRRVVAQVEASL